MEKYEFVKTEDVKTQGSFVKAICFRPKTAPIVCAVIGVALIALWNIYTIILGVFFILMAVVVVKFVKDYKVMDIFDKGVMIYGDEENKLALFIPFDEIKMWSVKREDGHDTVEFELNDSAKVIKETFEADKAYKVLIDLIREKEDKYIEAQKNREKPLSIPDALNNIKKHFTGKQ